MANNIISFFIGSMFTLLLFVLMKSYKNDNSPNPNGWQNVGGNIDIEYYLEVGEDSIWVESVNTKKVYSGKYTDLKTIINKDNL